MSIRGSIQVVNDSIRNGVYTIGMSKTTQGCCLASINTIKINLDTSAISENDRSIDVTGGTITIDQGIIEILSGTLNLEDASLNASNIITDGVLLVASTPTLVGPKITITGGQVFISNDGLHLSDNCRECVLTMETSIYDDTQSQFAGNTILDRTYINDSIECGPNSLSSHGMGVVKYINATTNIDLTCCAFSHYPIVVIKNINSSGTITITNTETLSNIPPTWTFGSGATTPPTISSTTTISAGHVTMFMIDPYLTVTNSGKIAFLPVRTTSQFF